MRCLVSEQAAIPGRRTTEGRNTKEYKEKEMKYEGKEILKKKGGRNVEEVKKVERIWHCAEKLSGKDVLYVFITRGKECIW